MAVRVGFEPTVRRTYAGFQDQCFRPLSHLTKKELLDNIKNLIKITRTDNTQSKNTNNSIFKIVSALNNHNYKDSLNELELINTNNILNEPIADIKNIQILYESVDVLIKWLIFKG